MPLSHLDRSSPSIPVRAARSLGWVLMLLCWLPCVEAAPSSGPDEAQLASMMQGDYFVVGRNPDSARTYSGHLTFHTHGKKLAFTRTVDGRTVRGTATFDTVAGADRIPVLRMHFVQNGQACEGTYQ